MSLKTPLCDLLGIDVPVLQAPLDRASTPELAAADLRDLTAAPFGVNVILS